MSLHYTNGFTPDTNEHIPPYPQPNRPVLDLLPPEGWKAELAQMTGYVLEWFTRPQTVSK